MTDKVKKTLEISIFGNPIKIVTDEEEEYVYKIVSFLNKKMEEITKNVRIASSSERMTLVCLSLTDELLKLREKKGNLSETSTDFSGIIKMIDEALGS